MKYSQYHEARELLESDAAQSYGYDINEWDSLPPAEKAEQLNEILGIAGLTTAFLRGVHFTSPTNGYVVGNGKNLLKYTETNLNTETF